MNTLLNNRFFVIYFAPFLLGGLTVLGFSPYNFTFINFISFSLILFFISIIKKKHNLNIEKIKQKNKIKDIFFSEKGATIKIANPKNNDKNKGINITAKGIKPLNISS